MLRGLRSRLRRKPQDPRCWVVFDFDGTVNQSTGTLVSFYNDALASHFKLRHLAEDDLERLKMMPLKEKIEYLGIPWYRLPGVIHRARKKFPAAMSNFPLMEGLREACEELNRKGYILAILSSNKRKNILDYLREHGLTCFTSVSCDKGKSLNVKHKTLLRFMRRERISPQRMVYVGDECRDVLATRKVHVPTISVTWGWDSFEVLSEVNAGQVISSAAELTAMVEAILGERKPRGDL